MWSGIHCYQQLCMLFDLRNKHVFNLYSLFVIEQLGKPMINQQDCLSKLHSAASYATQLFKYGVG